MIDALINQGATHLFKAKTNRDGAKMSIVATNSATNTALSINPVGPYSTNPGMAIESTIEVSATGSYAITSTASADGDSVSVSWAWIVSDQIGMCSTGYMDSELGSHIHLCGTDYTIGSAGIIVPVLSLLGFGIAVAGPLAIILGAELLIIFVFLL